MGPHRLALEIANPRRRDEANDGLNFWRALPEPKPLKNGRTPSEDEHSDQLIDEGLCDCRSAEVHANSQLGLIECTLDLLPKRNSFVACPENKN